MGRKMTSGDINVLTEFLDCADVGLSPVTPTEALVALESLAAALADTERSRDALLEVVAEARRHDCNAEWSCAMCEALARLDRG